MMHLLRMSYSLCCRINWPKCVYVSFFDVFEAQREEILSSQEAAFLKNLVCGFEDFKQYIVFCEGARNELDTLEILRNSSGGVFERLWAPFSKRFMNMKMFFDGLVNTFPGTAAVETDFFTIHFEAE